MQPLEENCDVLTSSGTSSSDDDDDNVSGFLDGGIISSVSAGGKISSADGCMKNKNIVKVYNNCKNTKTSGLVTLDNYVNKRIILQ